MAEHQPPRSRLERRRLELEEQAKKEAFSTEESITQERQEESVAYHRYVEAQPRNRKHTSRRSGNGVLRQVGQMVGRASSRLFASQERARRSRAADRSGKSETSTDVSSREANPKKMKKKRRFKRKLIGLFLLVLIGFVLFASQPFTFLLIGSDARPGESLRGSRSDSLSVMQFVPLSRTIQLTSIPRDTYTPISCENGKKDKITHAFAFGGEACTQDAVAGLLDEEIDGKIVISFDSFIGLVDQIGGINLVSTGTFSEQDASGKANQYSFQKGKEYHMDGAMALAYSRHRKTDNDGARANRQSEVIQAVATQLLKPTGWGKIPAAHTYMKEEMNLDLSVREMATAGLSLALMSERKHYEIEAVSQRLNGIFYDLPDEKALQQLRDRLDTTFYGTLKK
ncbi:LCP family protein [Exiguobacterium sp. TDN 0502]|uniref:LCP family protein n=1 Tax=Exiguobacterium sp. TDN 0502 TaxID=3420731 RepID=UPI003D776D57